MKDQNRTVSKRGLSADKRTRTVMGSQEDRKKSEQKEGRRQG